ncbi:MAG: LacI family DNA-binding transcriptional regulator [Cypionkella sp.]
MTRHPTILDVARAAGVSKSTVSLVFQKNPAVRAETREAVLRKVEARVDLFQRPCGAGHAQGVCRDGAASWTRCRAGFSAGGL